MTSNLIPITSSPDFCSLPNNLKSALAARSLAEKLRQLRQQAKQAIAAGRYRQAIAYLSQVIYYHPHSALDHNNRGLIYFYQGQFRNALKDYETAIFLDPTLDSPYNNRANCLVSLHRIQEAIADYERAIDLNPANIKTWLNFGITLRETNQYDLAIEKFDIALIISNCLQGHLYAERGYTYYLLGDWNCAIADYHRALVHLTPEESYYQKVNLLLQKLTNPAFLKNL